MKALIIDDSRTMRRLLASYLAEFTTDIFEAENGVQALEQLQLHAPIDLALVDWEMPKMNGLEFVKAVRADPALNATKLLMITSHNSREDLGEALAQGSNEYLMKPMTGEMVVDKIRLLGLAD
jgi:two-component system chemotaxis response regulator CheY